ncbi:MAG: hypothetical protein RSC24_06620 [Clostridium sp.]
MSRKIIKNFIGFVFILTLLMGSLSGCGSKEVVSNTIIVNGEIISSEKIDNENRYKNIIKLDNGEIWEHESENRIVQTDKDQFINKGNPDDVPDVVLIKIPAKSK